MAVERMALNAMDPNSPYGGNGQTVQDQLNQIAQQKAAVNELVQQAEPLMPTMSDQDRLSYTESPDALRRSGCVAVGRKQVRAEMTFTKTN